MRDIIQHYPTAPKQPITARISSSIPSTPQVGESYSRICIISKLSGLTRTPITQWMKVTMGTERINSPTPNEAALEFSPLRTSDAGRYRCQGNLNTTVQHELLSDSSYFDLIAKSESDMIHNIIIVSL